MYWFKSLDVFGSSVQLNYRKQLEYVSKLGALATIFMISFIASFTWESKVNFFVELMMFYISIQNQVYPSNELFIIEAIQFINKETILVQESLNYQTDPTLVTLNQQNFMFGVRISQSNFLKRPFFNITIEQKNYSFDDQGLYQQEKTTLQLVPCTEQHWKRFDDSYNFTNYLNLYNYDFLCPRLEDEMFLMGMFNSQSFSFVKVYVSNCVNATTPRTLGQWDPVCASKEDMDDYFKKEGVYGFSFIMTSSLINIQNQTSWSQYYLNDDHYFTFIPKQIAKSINTFFRLYDLKSDTSLWPQDSILEESIFSYLTGDMQQTVDIGRKDDQYVSLFLRRSPLNQKIQRRYQKISEFMSTLGGFIQLIFLIFRYFYFQDQQIKINILLFKIISFVFKKYNEFNLQVDLINQLYDFQLDDEQSPAPSSKLNQKCNQNSLLLAIQENPPIFNKQDNQQRTPSKEKNSFINQKLDFLKVDDSIKLDSAAPINIETSSHQNQQSKVSNFYQEGKILPIASPTKILNIQLNKSNTKKENHKNNVELINIYNGKEYSSKVRQNDQKKDYLHFNFSNKKIQNNSSQQRLQPKITQEEDKMQFYFAKLQNELEQSLKKKQNKESLFSKILRKFKKKNEEQKNKCQIQNNILNFKQNQFNQHIPFTEKLKSVIFKFKQLIKEKQKIFLSSSIFVCFKSNKRRWDMLKKGFDYIKNDLDICIIIEKIQEMQKMKNLLLTKEQEIIFNFIPKPIITLSSNINYMSRRSILDNQLLTDHVNFKQRNSQNKDIPTLVTRMSYNSLGAYQVYHQNYLYFVQKLFFDINQILFESYKKVKQENCEQNLVSQKLINFLGTELCELFDAYNFLLQNPQSTYLHKKINTLDISKQLNNVQKGDTRQDVECLKKSKEYQSCRQIDIEQSIKFGLEQLNILIKSQNINQISMQESESDNIESETQQEDISNKEMLMSSYLSQQEHVSFNNNINQLNKNVIQSYYQKTIQGYINNSNKK